MRIWGNRLSEGLPSDQQEQEERQSSEATVLEIKKEIVCVICKALMLVNQMQGSLHDFEDLLFRNDHNNSFALDYWSKNWRETEKLLKEFDYKGPKEYFICLHESHHVIGIWWIHRCPHASTVEDMAPSSIITLV